MRSKPFVEDELDATGGALTLDLATVVTAAAVATAKNPRGCSITISNKGAGSLEVRDTATAATKGTLKALNGDEILLGEKDPLFVPLQAGDYIIDAPVGAHALYRIWWKYP